MYLEMLYNLYGSALEKKAAAPDRKWWIARHGGSPYLVRKVTSPETGIVKRYQGSIKGPDYYKNMAPSNPSYYFGLSNLPKSSPYVKALDAAVDATMAGKKPSEENERLLREYYDTVTKKLKQKIRPKIERAPYVQ